MPHVTEHYRETFWRHFGVLHAPHQELTPDGVSLGLFIQALTNAIDTHSHRQQYTPWTENPWVGEALYTQPPFTQSIMEELLSRKSGGYHPDGLEWSVAGALADDMTRSPEQREADPLTWDTLLGHVLAQIRLSMLIADCRCIRVMSEIDPSSGSALVRLRLRARSHDWTSEFARIAKSPRYRTAAEVSTSHGVVLIPLLDALCPPEKQP